jgi:hypothetical protein
MIWTFVFGVNLWRRPSAWKRSPTTRPRRAPSPPNNLESVNRPPTAFVCLRRAIVARSADYPDLMEKYGPRRVAADDTQASVY